VKAARVTFPLPTTFIPFQIDFCSQACQSSLIALYISHSPSSLFSKASMSWSQSCFAPGTSPQTRLKFLTQLLCSAGQQTSHSTISFCHLVNHFSGPIDGHSIYFEPSRVQCQAQIRLVIWASVGFVEVCRLVIQIRTVLSACSIALFSLVMMVRILLRSRAISVRYLWYYVISFLYMDLRPIYMFFSAAVSSLSVIAPGLTMSKVTSTGTLYISFDSGLIYIYRFLEI
jgi:hypothetical protein